MAGGPGGEQDATPAGAVPAGARPRPTLVAVLAAVTAVGYALDQATKVWAVGALEPGQVVPVLDGVLQLRLIRNPGAAFGLAPGLTWLLTLMALGVVVVVLWVARRLGSRGWAVALGLLLAGALGNLTDRLLRTPGTGRGHVVDFLELPHWPVFNVADMAVVAAALSIAVLGFRGIGVDGRRERHVAGAGDQHGTNGRRG